MVLNHLSDTVVLASDIKQWTNKDPNLSRLRTLIQTGYQIPNDAPELQPYTPYVLELSVADGCILGGSRVIIPPQGRSQILAQLHETHPGISRMKSLARSYLWWPHLDKDIEELVKKCNTCQSHRAAPPQSPIHTWECPKTPWTRIHIDHAGPFLGQTFLILIDAYSRWLDVHIVPSTLAEATIKVLKQVFSAHGLPSQLVSDNGPAFTSQEFKNFMCKNGMRHSLTSPYHPRSNGLAE